MDRTGLRLSSSRMVKRFVSSWILVGAIVLTHAGQVRATVYVVGTTQTSATARAESLLIVVNCLATDGDVVKVRKGSDGSAVYQFAPASGSNNPRPGDCSPLGTRNGKPLWVWKNIQLIADQDRIVLDGGAGSNFNSGVEICDGTSGCYADPRSTNPSCDWVDQANSDANPLIAVNSFDPSTIPATSTKTTNRRSWNVVIKNFEIRNSFRSGGYNFLEHPGCTTQRSLYPGGAIEMWYTTATIEDCYLHHNSTTRYAGRGGAVFTSATGLTVKGSTIENNFGGYYGGALFMSEGAFGVGGPCCDLTSFPRDTCTVRIDNNIFRSNFAEFGGGFQFGSYACSSSEAKPLTAIVRNTLISENCIYRFTSGGPQVASGAGGSGVYVPSHAVIASFRQNTLVANKAKDNTGALYFQPGARVMADSLRLNVFANNTGGGVYVSCRDAAADSCLPASVDPTDWCVQGYDPPACSPSQPPWPTNACRGVLQQVENNLFWQNKTCDNTQDAHVLVGIGREMAETPGTTAPAVCTLGVTNWTCTSPATHCYNCANDQTCLNNYKHFRLLWADDPLLSNCGPQLGYLPRVEVSNKICDPDFCSTAAGSDFTVSCCSPAIVAYVNGHYGWKRVPCSGTSSCNGAAAITESSMAAYSSPACSGCTSMGLNFEFDTTYPAPEFEVRFRLQGASPWTVLPCTGPGGYCYYILCKHEKATTSYNCDTYKFEWQARVKNCLNAGWTDWKPTTPKKFTAYCITEP